VEAYYTRHARQEFNVGSARVYEEVAAALAVLAASPGAGAPASAASQKQKKAGEADSLAARGEGEEDEGGGEGRKGRGDRGEGGGGAGGARSKVSSKGRSKGRRSSGHTCLGAFRQQCVFENVCLRGGVDYEDLSLQYFTSGRQEGRQEDRLGRLPLSGREDVCEFLNVELLPSAEAPDAAAFIDATTLLIESVVPENAGRCYTRSTTSLSATLYSIRGHATSVSAILYFIRGNATRALPENAGHVSRGPLLRMSTEPESLARALEP
jgi:hypothetical protein